MQILEPCILLETSDTFKKMCRVWLTFFTFKYERLIFQHVIWLIYNVYDKLQEKPINLSLKYTKDSALKQ